MSISIKTLDDYGFLLCFIGGIIGVVLGLVGFIMSLAGTAATWYLGAGYIGMANAIAGTIITILFSVCAILMGMKLFDRKIRKSVIKIDLLITSIIMIVIGLLIFGIGGLLILIGGILVIIYRLSPAGEANPYGK